MGMSLFVLFVIIYIRCYRILMLGSPFNIDCILTNINMTKKGLRGIYLDLFDSC